MVRFFGRFPIFLRFCLVGGAVFVIGNTILYLEIHGLHINPFWALFPMLFLTMTCSWLLNRWLTFQATNSLPWWREWLGFMAVNGIGAAINAGVYTLVLLITSKMGLMPYIALSIGTLVALSWNYLGSRRLILGDKKH